jgi:hypothetical protein
MVQQQPGGDSGGFPVLPVAGIGLAMLVVAAFVARRVLLYQPRHRRTR